MGYTNQFNLEVGTTLNTTNIPKKLNELNAQLQKSTSTKIEVPVKWYYDKSSGEKIVTAVKNVYKEVNTYKDKLGNTFKEIKHLDSSGNLIESVTDQDGKVKKYANELVQTSSALKTLTTETHKFANTKGEINEWSTSVDNMGKSIQTRTKQYVSDTNELITETSQWGRNAKGQWTQLSDTIKTTTDIIKENTTSTSTVKGQIDDLGKSYQGLITTTEKVGSNGEYLRTVVSKYTNEMGQAVVKTEQFDKAGNQVATTMRKISDAMPTVDTKKSTFIDADGNKTITEYKDNVAVLRTEIKQYKNDLGELVVQTDKYDAVTNNLISTHQEVKRSIQDEEKAQEKYEQQLNNVINKLIEQEEAQKRIKEGLISTTSTTSIGKVSQFGDNSGKEYDAIITKIEKINEANETVIKTTAEFVNGQGQLCKQFRETDKDGNKLKEDIIEISNETDKAAKFTEKLSIALNQVKPKNNKTATFIDANGNKTITEYVNNVATLRTEIKQYTDDVGNLITLTEKYDAVTNQLISSDEQLTRDIQAEIAEDKKKEQELDNLITKIIAQREEQEKLNNALISTTTTHSRSNAAQWGDSSGREYEALVTTIKSVDAEGKKTIKTIEEFTNAEGQLVQQTRVTDEYLHKIAEDEQVITDQSNRVSESSNKASNGLGQLGQQAEKANYGVKNLGWTLSDAFSRLANFYLASLPLRAMQKAISETLSTLNDFDDALVEFRKVSDLAGESLTNYVSKLAEMGELTGSTMQAMVEAATEFKRSSFNDADSAKLASVAEMYRNIADEEISAADSASFLISQMKAFNINANEAEHIIDAVNEVSNNFAVSSADIATNLNKMSAVMAVNNVTFEEQIGMLTGVTEITRNASSATRGLTMIASRLTQVLDDSSSTGKKLSAIYDKLGISLKDENGQLRSTYDILKDLSEKWDTLSENEQKYISLTSAGARQQNIFTSLMKNFNNVIEATETAYNSAGSAARENAKVIDTISKKTEILRSEFQQIVIGKGGLTDLAKGFLDIGVATLKLVNALGGLTPLLVTLAGVLITLKADSIVSGFLKFDKSCKSLTQSLTTVIPLFIEGKMQGMSFGDALKYAGVSATVAQIALGALTAVISLVVIAFKKYQQQQEENHRKAKEALEDYKNYSDSLDDTLRKIEDENTTKKELIDINKKLNDSYDSEKAQLKDINDLRAESLELLYKENKEKAQATVRETSSETQKAQDYLGSTVKETDLGTAGIKRNPLFDTFEYESIMLSTVGKSRAEQLEIVGQAIDKYNEKVSNNIELSKIESWTLQQLSTTYSFLKEKYDDATNTVNTYNEAEKVLNQTEEEFVNALRAKAEEQNTTTELTIEEQNKLIEQYHLTEEAIQQVMDAEEGMTRSEAIQYLVEQAEAANKVGESIEDLAKTLGITATELEGLRKKFDDLTLEKFLSQLVEAKETISDTNSVIDNLQSALDSASKALEEYNQNGYLTLDTFQSLMNISAQYLTALVNENGQLEINQTTLGNLVEKLKEAKIHELQAAETTDLLAYAQGNVSDMSALAQQSVTGAGNAAFTAGQNAASGAQGFWTLAQAISKANEAASGARLSTRDMNVQRIHNSYKKLADQISNVKVNTTAAGNAAKSAGRAGAGAAKQAKDATKDLNNELEKTKSQYEKVISWISKQYDRKIDSIKKSKDEATKAIEAEIKALEKEKDTIIGGLDEKKDALERQKDKVLDGIEAQIKALEKEKDARQKYWDEQIDALKKANQERKDALELQEKLDALERARNTKVKIYKEGQGFVYDVDQTKVAEAQKALDEYLSEKAYEDELARLEALKDAELDNYEQRIDALNEYKDKRQEAFEKEIQAIEDYKDSLEKSYDEQLDALKEHKEAVEEEYDAEIEIYENYKQEFEDMVNAYEEQQNKLLFEQLTGISAENDNWMTRLDNLAEFVRKYNQLQKQLDTGNTDVTNDASMKSGGGGGGYGGGYDSGSTRTVTNQDTPNSQYTPDYNTNYRRSGVESSLSHQGYHGMPTNVKKYASGADSIKDDQIAIVGESPNQEIVIGSKLNSGELMALNKGSGVVNAESSTTLAGMLNQVGKYGSSGFGSGNGTLNNNINNDSLVVNGVTIEGSNISDPQTFVNGLLSLKTEALQRAYKHR